MDVFGYGLKGEPLDIIGFVRLAVLDLCWIDVNFKIKCDPVRWPALMLSVDIPISQKFKSNHVRTIFFAYFSSNRILNGITMLHSSTADVPTSMFVTAICISQIHHKSAVPIMAKVHDTYTDEIETFLHTA